MFSPLLRVDSLSQERSLSWSFVNRFMSDPVVINVEIYAPLVVKPFTTRLPRLPVFIGISLDIQIYKILMYEFFSCILSCATDILFHSVL